MATVDIQLARLRTALLWEQLGGFVYADEIGEQVTCRACLWTWSSDENAERKALVCCGCGAPVKTVRHEPGPVTGDG